VRVAYYNNTNRWYVDTNGWYVAVVGRTGRPPAVKGLTGETFELFRGGSSEHYHVH